jgi:hypothetical protein
MAIRLSSLGGGRLKSQFFNTSGNFTVPNGVESVIVTLWGGGGSGARCVLNRYDIATGGGASIPIIDRPVSVTGGAVIPVVIAAGGSAIASGTSEIYGNNGGNTSFGSLVAVGAGGGVFVSNATIFPSISDSDANSGAFWARASKYSVSTANTAGESAINMLGDTLSSPYGSCGLASRSITAGETDDVSIVRIAHGGIGGYNGNGTDAKVNGNSIAATANSGAGSGSVIRSTGDQSIGAGGSGGVIVRWFE